MKKSLIIIFLLVFNLIFIAQSKFDSLKITKVKSSWYIRSIPIGIYTGAGVLKDKMFQYVEVGRSYGVIDIGITYGRINLRPDTSQFVEARMTMDASQYSIFSNEFSLGIGKVFNPENPFMLEISYTIFAQVGKNFGIGLSSGYYDFSGVKQDINKNYIGLFMRYGLLRDYNGILNRRSTHKHIGR